MQASGTREEYILHVGLSRVLSFLFVIPEEVEHTIPILSANFLLMGLVCLLTKVPSGYNKKQNGLFSFLASLPKDASWEASWTLSAAHDLARNMKLKNCMPCLSLRTGLPGLDSENLPNP